MCRPRPQRGRRRHGMADPTLGVLGGRGLSALPGLEGVERLGADPPFGPPSDQLVIGRLGGTRLVFLPRHGRGHRLLPTEINFRANIFALKQIGVEWIVAVNAVGSLRAEIAPGHVVVPDQFIDRTRQRQSTFFGRGVVAHTQFADPVCPNLSRVLAEAARAQAAAVHAGGTYVCMEGPQFSTRAESHLYRSWGAHVIGMTNLQEAKLAREAEICLATLALATDYDCWNAAHGEVEIEDVLRVLAANVGLARRTITRVAAALPARTGCPCPTALDHAIVTERAPIPATVRRELSPFVFLANINPELQESVLEQFDDPAVVACDTMNHWIASARASLVALLPRVDLLVVNDEEARLLAGEHIIARAARRILELGPRSVLVKRGEYGAILFSPESVFAVPAYPLEEVFDPTGAGDAFP